MALYVKCELQFNRTRQTCDLGEGLLFCDFLFTHSTMPGFRQRNYKSGAKKKKISIQKAQQAQAFDPRKTLLTNFFPADATWLPESPLRNSVWWVEIKSLTSLAYSNDSLIIISLLKFREPNHPTRPLLGWTHPT